MKWTREFHAKQYAWLERPQIWPEIWARISQGDPPARVGIIERLVGRGEKRILELGCGSGIIAGAIAAAGNSVVAVDIAAVAAANARRVAASIPAGRMEVIEGDFFEIDPSGAFDAVCYFDGFDLGSDNDPRRLLRRIAGWLVPGGCALIDIYNPYHFMRAAGDRYEDGDRVEGRTVFDPEGSRLLNTIWRRGEKHDAITESLRC